MRKVASIVAGGLIGFAVAVSPVAADINYTWGALYGFYNNGTPPVDPNDYIGFGGNQTLAQFIWSPLAVADAPTSSGGVTGDDILLDTFVVASVYGDYSVSATIYQDVTYGATLGGSGFVYARIFDSTTPGGGSWYFDGSLVATIAYDPNNPVFQAYQHNADSTGVGDELNQQVVIPEPSAFAFLGLGVLLVAARRRMRRS